MDDLRELIEERKEYISELSNCGEIEEADKQMVITGHLQSLLNCMKSSSVIYKALKDYKMKQYKILGEFADKENEHGIRIIEGELEEAKKALHTIGKL